MAQFGIGKREEEQSVQMAYDDAVYYSQSERRGWGRQVRASTSSAGAGVLLHVCGEIFWVAGMGWCYGGIYRV